MLRCSAFARAALRASKQDVAQVTRTLNQLSLHPQSASLSSSAVPIAPGPSSVRTFATTTAKRPRRPAAGKPATLKKRTPTKKKTAAKKKPITRKKAKKPVAKKPKKRVLSEKGKAALEKKKALTALRELKAIALVEPKGKPATAWSVYVAETLKGKSGVITEGMKSASTEYKSLSASEREHYNHIANQNKAENDAAYADWVKSHTPEQIRKANAARSTLKRKVSVGKAHKRSGRGLSPIKDERQIKRPLSAYFKFSTERRNSGDFKGIALGEAAKLITTEWKELSAGDKKTYEDLHVADKERYLREYERAYGHSPPSSKQSTPS